MKRIGLIVLAGAAGVAGAGYTNVALNAEVSLVAGGVNGAALSTLTDGVFRPRSTQWQNGTVWWNGTTPTMQIDLGGVFNIGGAILQGDDNDAYRILYRNMDTGAFETMWDVPNYDNFGGGMQTRPNPDDDTEVFLLGQNFLTDAVRVVAVSGDNAYSVSEVQLFVIPAPASIGLLLGLAAVRRRR